MLNKKSLATAVAVVLAAPLSAYATNGMNLAGYGPIATGMGGASMAYDNGTAAMMNNPATMGFADDGMRLDLALGNLGPDVSASMPDGSKWASGGDSYMMPAVGWSRNSGPLGYGVGMFAQGGMGTEFVPTATTPAPGAGGMMQQTAFTGNATTAASLPVPATQGAMMKLEERSEVGVMRILVPMNYQVSDNVIVGGSIDYVRASMDLKMAMPGANMFSMMTGGPGGKIDGTMINAMMPYLPTTATGMAQPTAGAITDIHGGYFDFSDSSDYSGQTEGAGFAAKIGVVFQVSDQLSIGATYHGETSLSDLEGSADMTMYVATAAMGDQPLTLNGDIAVKNFEWPSTVGVGVSFKATDRLMIAADVKKIGWAAVMKEFAMTFTADQSASNNITAFGMDMRGKTLNATLDQNWDDQTVIQLGAAYQVTDALTVRAGVNRSSNPIPESTLHYLFPAIVENHTTLGAGYDMGDSEVNFSYTMAAEVSATNTSMMTIDHSQTSWQIMYSKMF